MVEYYPRKNTEANNLVCEIYNLNTFPTLCALFYSGSMHREKGQKYSRIQ